MCNFSAFNVEVKEDFPAAIELAKDAFNESLKLFSLLEQKEQEETLKGMILLEDNIRLWE